MQYLGNNIKSAILVCTLILMPISFLLSSAYSADLEQIFVVEGETYDENLGFFVQSPGDLNGDGFSEVYVMNVSAQIKVFNGGNPASIDPIKIYEGHLPFNAWINDINGDGIKDFVFHSRLYTDPMTLSIFFGGDNFYSKIYPDLEIHGVPKEGFDQILTDDYNNDNEPDLIFSIDAAPFPVEARFYLYEAGINLDTIPDDTLSIYYDTLVAVYTHRCVGDIDNDGFSDYVTSTYTHKTPGYILIFWGANPLDSIPDLKITSPFDDAPGIGAFGIDIVPTGDLNKDGVVDFIVTSEGYPPCIFYGGNPFDPTPKILEYPGKVANICGDINNDGWQDIAVGFTSYDFGSGVVFVYFGAYDMDTIADIVIPYNSVAPLPYNFGRSVGPAGDFNGDGVDDLAVGSKSDNTQNSSGSLYVFAGDPNLPTPAEDEPEAPVPIEYDILRQNYPNPFNLGTVIEYDLHGLRERFIDISIYDLLGRKVRTLFKDFQEGGHHNIFWNGLDDSGHTLASGIYFCVMATGQEKLSKKMILLK